MNILLITGTIKPLVKVKYDNPKVRLAEYTRNIEKYITKSNFDTIIFLENSGYSFDYLSFEKLAEKNGKKFEYLNLSANAEKNNMSIGEANMMREAFSCSQYLKKLSDSEFVWKVTGRIYINNINDYVNGYSKNVFLYSKKYNSIQTWFFRGNVKALKKYLLSDDTIENMKNSCIEYAWMDCYSKNKDNISIERFKVYPDAEGINSSGVPYTLPKSKYAIKNIALKFGRFSIK